MSAQSIHQDQPLLTSGSGLEHARAAVILLHGRGAIARDILGLADQLPRDAVAYLAPQAAGNTWYPHSGFLPIEANEPYISSAFATLAQILTQVLGAGVGTDKIVLGGFSQGACLAAEFVARHPQRYGGLFVLSGALLGPPDMARHYPGSLAGTPVYVGGADQDGWVTGEQLRMTGRVLQELGATANVEITPSRDHTIRPAEIASVRRMVSELAEGER